MRSVFSAAPGRSPATPADDADTPRLASRYDELRQLLLERQREFVAALRDLEASLAEMRAQTLGRIDQAIAGLDAGLYGSCRACGEDIASERLRALPFAVRCRACEDLREAEKASAWRHRT